MRPILYENNEKDFKSEGIGSLTECLACIVTEERNGVYELEMDYPTSGQLFNELKNGRIILAKPNETSRLQPFQIYKIELSHRGIARVNAEHISYRLSGMPVRPFQANGITKALNGIFQNSLVPTQPFSVWTDVSNESTAYTVNEIKTIRSCLGGSRGSILDKFSGSSGAELEFDRFKVKLHQHRGRDNGVRIEYGKNLTDLKQEQNNSYVYTGVVAFWEGGEGKEYCCSNVQYVTEHEKYPSEKVYILDVSQEFDTKPSMEQLNNKASKYAKDNKINVPKLNIKINFVALWQAEQYKEIAPLERVSLCDVVTISFPKFGIDAKAKVIKTVYDVIKERYNTIELGDAKPSFSQTITDTVGQTVDKVIQNSTVNNSIKDIYNQQAQMADGLSNLSSSIKTTISAILTEFYSSTSKTVLEGGAWGRDVPSFDSGRYIWERLTYYFKDGSSVVNAPICLVGDVQEQISSMQNIFFHDMSGAYVKDPSSDSYTKIDAKGMHIFVHGHEVAYYTSTLAYVNEMAVGGNFHVGKHRVASYELDNDWGTALLWEGD